ncbi:hypothetical protein PENTCL1PPCAC_3897 [Pristionchus entomophagus]|uniref:SCP domain-containing protein n=1 Tax=Pristionchus entomophagus TaxID=358040 RepID=A0AAV5SGF7_9BILA|nr:hypothetical protein PENTCL1PPCAC_3897 [Pristionchus entomophagus]
MRSLILLLLVGIAHGINVTLINTCNVPMYPRVATDCCPAPSCWHPHTLAPNSMEWHEYCGNKVLAKNGDNGLTKASIELWMFQGVRMATSAISISAGFDVGMAITPWDNLSLGTLGCDNPNCFGGATYNQTIQYYYGEFYLAFLCV